LHGPLTARHSQRARPARTGALPFRALVANVAIVVSYAAGRPRPAPSRWNPAPGYTDPPLMPNETIEQQERMAAEPGVWTTGPDGELVPDYESTFPTINEGEVVHGTVVRVDKDEVLVDIGYKSEGV